MSLTLMPYAPLPGEVLMDDRLKPTHIRVLIALYMHSNKKREAVWPKRKTLSRLTGIHEATISRLTTELEQMGWVTKEGNTGGCNRPATYHVHVPDHITSNLDVTVDENGDIQYPKTVAESATVAKSTTVAKSARATVAKSATPTVAKSARRKEQPIEQPINTSPEGDVAEPPVQPASLHADTCPHQAIIDLYHEKLPMGTHVRHWTPARQQALRARWREDKSRQSLQWWGRFFDYVAASDFLTGRVSNRDRRPFEISLDWICKSENFVKVLEGRYENREMGAAA